MAKLSYSIGNDLGDHGVEKNNSTKSAQRNLRNIFPTRNRRHQLLRKEVLKETMAFPEQHLDSGTVW